MKNVIVSLIIVLGLVCPSAASPIIIGGSPTWTSAGEAAFWNNRSYDGNGIANIGDFLVGPPGSDYPGFYTLSPSLSTLEWLGDGSTTWTWDRPVTPTVLLSGVTAWHDTFWIDQGVFYFQSPYDTWTSTQLDNGRSHFALFRSGSTYYLGMEDATWATVPTADWDYNDLIISWTEPVPDAGSTVFLLASALLAFALIRR